MPILMETLQLGNTTYQIHDAEIDKIFSSEEAVVPAYTNVWELYGYQDGKWLNDNGEATDQEGFALSGFIPYTLDNVLRIRMTSAIGVYSKIGFYDANKNKKSVRNIKAILDSPSVYGTATLDSTDFVYDTSTSNYSVFVGTAYIRLALKNGNDSTIATVSEEISGSTMGEVYALRPSVQVPKQSIQGGILPLSGNVVVCLGDSILALIDSGDGVVGQAEKTVGGDWRNCAFGGSRMTATNNSTYNAFCFANLADAIASGNWSAQNTAVQAEGIADHYAPHLETLKAVDWSNVDALYLHYGTNDWAASSGVALDGGTSTDKTKIIDALKYGINTILTAYPHIHIFVGSLIFRYLSGEGSDTKQNTNGVTIPQVNAAYKTVCDSFHMPYVDNYNTAGINLLTYSTLLSDGTHPSASGCKVLGRVIGGSVLSPKAAS